MVCPKIKKDYKKFVIISAQDKLSLSSLVFLMLFQGL